MVGLFNKRVTPADMISKDIRQANDSIDPLKDINRQAKEDFF